MRRWVMPAVATISMLILGAGPTTKPARPVPASWPAMANDAYHFHYRVPPQWKTIQQSDTATAFRIGQSPNTPPALFTVIVGPCHEATTEADAAEQRKSIAADHPKAKIVKDQRGTLGDQPAWLIAYDDTQTMTVTRRSGNSPPQTTEVHIPWKVVQISRVVGNLHYYVSFESGTAAYSANLPTVQQVIDSFTWTPAPAGK